MLTTEGATKLDTFWKIRINGFAIFSSSKISLLSSSASSSAHTLWLSKSKEIKQMIILKLSKFENLVYIIAGNCTKNIPPFTTKHLIFVYALLLFVLAL